MLNLATTSGQTIQLRRTHLTAQHGPHAGRTFRIDDVTKVNGKHVVVASRKHNKSIRHMIKVAPEVFGIVVTEVEEIIRTAWTKARRVWARIDDGLYMGTMALIPLAYFEHYDMAEKIVEFFNHML